MNGVDGELFRAINQVVVRNIWFERWSRVDHPKGVPAFGTHCGGYLGQLAWFGAEVWGLVSHMLPIPLAGLPCVSRVCSFARLRPSVLVLGVLARWGRLLTADTPLRL